MHTLSLMYNKTFDASIEDVFNAWTDPIEIAKWYGPEGFTIDIHSFHLKEGGEYRLTMHAPDGLKHILRGEFKTVERPTKLAFTWQWEAGGSEDSAGKETLVEIELREVNGKTEMTFTHSGFIGKSAKQLHEFGWTSCFTKLDKFFI